MNTNIAMGYQPTPAENPLNALAKIMQIKQAQQDGEMGQMKMDEYTRTKDRSNKLIGILGGMGADATDETRSTAMRNAGYLDEADKFDAGSLARKKTGGEVAAKDFELAKNRHGMVQNTLGAVAHDQNLSKEMVLQASQSLLDQGIITPQMHAHTATLPDDPAQLRTRLLQGVYSQLTPEQLIAAYAPKTEYKDNGQALVPVQTNPNAPGYTPPANIQKFATPGEKLTDERTRSEGGLNRGVTIAGQNKTDARARELAAATRESGGKPPAGYRWSADGKSLEAITGGPADKGSTSSEGERKAATLLQRLEFSSGQLDAARKDDPGASRPGLISNGLESIGMDATANSMKSAARQRIEGAQLDMLDAALTLGTGAAYTNEQLKGYAKSYFPQIGDDAPAIKDKDARLKNVISAAKIAAGRAAKSINVDGAEGDFGTTSPKNSAPATNSQGWVLHTDAKGNKAYVSPDGKQFQEAK